MLYDSDAYVVVQLKPSTGSEPGSAPRVESAVQVALAKSHAPDPTTHSDPSNSLKLAAQQQHLRRDGFEIVDKQRGREVYLDGSWAEMFQAQLDAWQQRTPSQDEVEATLEGYAALAQNPVRLH